MISESEKEQAKEVLEQVGVLAKEFAPLIKPIAEEYMGALLDTKAVTQAQIERSATDIACTLLRVYQWGPADDSLLAERAVRLAKMIAQGAKE